MTAKEDIKEQLDEIKARNERKDRPQTTEYDKGIATGLQIALHFIEYHEIDKSIKDFRKEINT